MADHIRPELLTRKDKATTFTRKLILEDALSANLRPYTELTDVILSAACFAVPRGGHISAATVGSLTTRQSPPTPLHATIYMVPATGSPIGRLLLDRTRWSRSVWFDIFDMPEDEDTWWWAYRSRSVIRIAPNGWFRSIRAHFRSDRATLAHILYQCLFCSPDPINPSEGRLYFCVTPEIWLLTGQLQGLETDPLDVARTAVYDALYIVSRRDHRHVGWSNEQKAAYYDSMLEFVAPGFQPPFPSDITRSVSLFNPHPTQADIPVVKTNEPRDWWKPAEAIMRRT